MNNGTDLLWDNMRNPMLMGFFSVIIILTFAFGFAYIWLMIRRR